LTAQIEHPTFDLVFDIKSPTDGVGAASQSQVLLEVAVEVQVSGNSSNGFRI
jgi:hypothetical protein